MKACRKCGVEKALDEFYTRRSEPDGRAKTCRACGVTKVKVDRDRRTARRLIDTEYDERQRSYNRNYRRKVREEQYGMPAGQLASLLSEQNERCAICRQTPDEVACRGTSGQVLHVDHDHVTGVVRGLLCKKCNSLLGMAGDDVDRLMAAAAYLLQRQPALEVQP